MEKFTNRRRNYYIDRKFQTNFILKFCSLVALGSFISGGVIYMMSKAAVTTTFVNSRLAIKSTADYILPAVLMASAIVIIVIGLATIIVTLFTSHKIAGPLYRLDKDVQEVAKGNLAMRFRLRAGDEVKALATSLNTMAETLKNDIGSIKGYAQDLDSAIDSLERPEERERLKERSRAIRQALDKFKT